MGGILATSTDAADFRRSWDLPVLVFAALFVASLVAAISALFDDTFIIGAPLADADLDGIPLVIEGNYLPGAHAAEHRAELQALIDSIRID